MKNILIKFIKNKCRCTHKNALLNTENGYCPDCGEYLVKKYYLLRCSRCDIKREAKLFWGEIIPKEKYCANCGSNEYYIERLEKVSFIDAKYAIYLKEIVATAQAQNPQTQIWVDEGEGILKQITASCFT